MSTTVFAKEASLKTLSVSIQALVVNGKQMTLSCFRQLPEGITTKQSGDLAPGTWWGLVRYKIKNEGDLWAVREHNGRLYRCRVDTAMAAWAGNQENEEVAVKGDRDRALEELDSSQSAAYIAYKGQRHLVLPGNKEKVRQAILDQYEIELNLKLSIAREADSVDRLLTSLEQLFIAV